MERRRLLLTSILTAVLFVSVAPDAVGMSGPSERTPVARAIVGGGSFRPDAWIKLCGLSTGCVIDPLPHPWLGKDVYNATGRRQTVSVDINEGEGVRFWITVENDGTESDTLVVQGCRGNRTFEVNRAVLGKHKRPTASATDVTRRYKQGTLTFDLEPGKTAVFTLNIVTHVNKGVTYRCLTVVHSQNDPSSEDTVVSEMTTY